MDSVAALLAAPPVGPGRRLYHLPADSLGGTAQARAHRVLDRHARALGLDRMPGSLVLVRSFASPVGEHVRFRQESSGVPVFGSEVSVHFGPDGGVLVVNADVFEVPAVAPFVRVSADEARAIAAEASDPAPGETPEVQDPAAAWLPAGKSARLAWRVVARSAEESLRVFVDALDGSILEAHDLRRSAEGEARVFRPNPVFSARDGSFRDFSDADTAALAAELVDVALPRLDGSGSLRGAWADLTPTRPAAFDAGLDFAYPRSDDRFEAASAYWHVDDIQQRIQGVLGFSDVLARPQKIDARANGDDNSYFDDGNGRLYFGTGGVDDAEDGDIVAHEYGHALQADMVPDFGLGYEAASMGEGFGDYQAATRHDSGIPLWDAAVGSWDATSFSSADPPFLRRVDGSKSYPGDLEGEIHADGEIWSAALWAIRGEIGTAAADRIVLGHCLLLTPRATFADAAAAVVAANLSLRGGADEEAIRAAFTDRGIPVGDDPFEEDDSPAAATFVDRGGYPSLWLADEDWFRFTAEAGDAVTVMAGSPDGGLHMDVALLREDLTLAAEDDDFGGPVSVSTGVAAARRTFLLRVSARGRKGAYALAFTGGLETAAADPLEPNDAAEAAARLPTGAPVEIRLSPGQDDWFLLEGAAGSRIRALASFDNGALDADLALFAPDGTTALASSATAAAQESIDWTSPDGGPGTVLLRARGASGSGAVELTAWVDPPRVLGRRGRVEGTLVPGEERTFGVDVSPGHGATPLLKVIASRAGPSGAAPEVEALSPGGFLLAAFGEGFDGARTSLLLPAPEEGVYRLRLRSASEGRFRLKTRVKP